MATKTRSSRPPARRTRLTAAAVDSLATGDYTDPAVKGLQLRVRALGPKDKPTGMTRTWLFRYQWTVGSGGTKTNTNVRLAIGRRPTMSLADARERALTLRRLLDDGIDPRRARSARRDRAAPVSLSAASVDPSAQRTVAHLASEFMDRFIKPNRRRPEYVQRILDKDVLPLWQNRDARTITPGEVIELLDGIVDRGSRVMANHTAGILAQLFKFGIHRKIVDTTPVQLLMRPGGKQRPRRRVLSDKELRIFLADPLACTRQQRLARAMMILLTTGVRRGELAAARWRDVDLKRHVWRVPPEDTKKDVERLVPLTDLAVAEFKVLNIAAGRSRFVLPGEDGNALDAKYLTRSLARCETRFKKRGIAKFTLHDLRRTLRTGLGVLKVPPDIRRLVVGHKKSGMDDVYDVHDYFDEKREALEKWSAHLESLKGAK